MSVYDCTPKDCEHYLTNRVWEFYHIYNLRTVGNEGELFRFSGEKVKDQGHDWTTKALPEF